MRVGRRSRAAGSRGIVALVALSTTFVGLSIGTTLTIDATGNAGATAGQPGVRGKARAVPVEWSVTQVGDDESIRFGTSRAGRPLTALRRQGQQSGRSVMVVGVIHGDEVFGRRVTDGLTTVSVPNDLDLWVVPTINPDGEASGRHGNAAGVDLNRNFPVNWQTGTFYSSGKYFSGPGPASEPETQAIMGLIGTVQPDVVVWYHSPWDRVDCDHGRVGEACDRFSTAVGLEALFTSRPGTATDWLLTETGTPSFVVEFGSTAPSANTVARHVLAILAISATR